MIDQQNNVDEDPTHSEKSMTEGMDNSDSEMRWLVLEMLLEPRLKPALMDSEKVQSVLKQILREWSTEGRAERNKSFGPILDALERYVGSRTSRHKVPKKSSRAWCWIRTIGLR